MQKKIDITQLDIPHDDIEAWDRYPKHNWVYDLSRLLDAQHIKWSPFRTDTLNDIRAVMVLDSLDPFEYKTETGFIFIKPPDGKEVISEVYITKGDIKLMRHLDRKTKIDIQEDVGEVELRLSAFNALFFQKFSGVITAISIGSDLYSIRLRPYSESALSNNPESVKLTKRIYKKHVIHLIGATHQVYHESFTS